ncbi:glutamyl-tRNA reductase [Mucilaginibacter gotjawali]|nr:glutamyl-tRNA reductase [Mucilaginibacter gotjawali]MBB3058787.1 glutamyl-tRNA reductase [Mucilaginibacter gotjawali]
MDHTSQADISKFFIAGINYKKTDAAIRGMFAINNDQYANILTIAPESGLHSFFIISTCNRTEIYGFADNVGQLINLLCTQTTGDSETFNRLAYIKNGADAVEHLFEVGAGLDSQILGDYEITGQLKQSIKFAKGYNFINCFLERLVNSVFQSSKMIRNETALSSGTVSVSYAAVEYIKENINLCAGRKILVIGIGKIGRNTCKNLVDYLGTTNITLINRSEEKAAELAAELGLAYAPIEDLAAEIKNADVILVAANAAEPIVLKSHLEGKNTKLVVDLSIPYNVEASAGELPNVSLVNVDALSKINDNTLMKRRAEIPKVKCIIAQNMAGFMDWYMMRKNAPALHAIKSKLVYLYMQHFSDIKGDADKCPVMAAEKKIQKVINGIAGKMREEKQHGCNYIEAINDFIVSVNN